VSDEKAADRHELIGLLSKPGRALITLDDDRAALAWATAVIARRTLLAFDSPRTRRRPTFTSKCGGGSSRMREDHVSHQLFR
jgi:hypothetical protein